MEPSLLSWCVQVPQKKRRDFIAWQGEFSQHVSHVQGFTSLEFLAPRDPSSGDWCVNIRFATGADASNWKKSVAFQEMIQRLNPSIVPGSFKIEQGHDGDLLGNVTELFFTRVDPGHEHDFRAWSAKMHEAEAHFPGFRGAYLQAPKEKGGHWLTLLQFDSIPDLERWLNSPERKAILDKPFPWISSLESNRMASSYAGWFASLGKDEPAPPVWKQTMLVLLVLYPIVMLEIKFLNPLLSGISNAFATFIGNAISVSLIAYPLMPLALFALGWWCLPKEPYSHVKNILGFMLLIILYMIEIFIFL
jgi:antibiotic biosynthesis monooxygenase (ABM) superfamily enzyme